MRFRRYLGATLVPLAVLGSYTIGRATATPPTCVRLNTVTCTSEPTSAQLTPGTIPSGKYIDDENGPDQGWLVTDSGRDTVAALQDGRTCLDIGANHSFGHGLERYLCVKLAP